MNRKKTTNMLIGFIVIITLIGGLAMLPGQSSAVAPVTCPTAGTADSDGDGLTDYAECNGITLNADPSGIYPGFYSYSDADTNTRLDPNRKDLFVIVVPATQQGASYSNLPVDPLMYVANLNVNIHRIDKAQIVGDTAVVGNRCVLLTTSNTCLQQAVRITENLDPNSEYVGISNYGTPNGLDGAIVYTEKIKNFVIATCGNYTCVDADGTTSGVNAIIGKYIRHTIAHELGHTVSLDEVYTARFGGNHYKSGSGLVMDQTIIYTGPTKGKITFYIPTQFGSGDIGASLLQ